MFTNFKQSPAMPEKPVICVDENFKLEEQFILRVPEVRKVEEIHQIGVK